jgi:hypothetical protein
MNKLPPWLYLPANRALTRACLALRHHFIFLTICHDCSRSSSWNSHLGKTFDWRSGQKGLAYPLPDPLIEAVGHANPIFTPLFQNWTWGWHWRTLDGLKPTTLKAHNTHDDNPLRNDTTVGIGLDRTFGQREDASAIDAGDADSKEVELQSLSCSWDSLDSWPLLAQRGYVFRAGWGFPFEEDFTSPNPLDEMGSWRQHALPHPTPRSR